MPYQRVDPGDLITAAGFNQLLDALETLETRVLALEAGAPSGNQLTITRLEPVQAYYRIGDPLTVIGTNFELTQGNLRAFLGTSQILFFGSNSTDGRLEFVIPAVVGVQETGTPVNLRVANSTQEVLYPLVLRPALQVLFGDVDVEYRAVNPTTIVENQPVTFQYRIRSRASDDADFLIDPLIGIGSNQNLWQSRLVVLDQDFNTLPSRLLRLSQQQERIVHVRISQVPSGTTGTNFTLTVSASSGGVSGSSGARSFQVGEAVPDQDNSIAINPDHVLFGSGTLAGDSLTVPAGASAVVVFNVDFSRMPPMDSDTYNLTLALSPSGTAWQAEPFDTPTSYVISAADISPGTGRAQRSPQFTITAPASGSASARLDVIYQREGADANNLYALNLNVG